MRSILFSIVTALLIGCVATPDPIDQLVARLSQQAVPGRVSATFSWDSGISPVLGLPPTASTDEVVSKAMKMGGHSQVTDYKILKIRTVREERGDLPHEYTAVLIQTPNGQKIVLFKYIPSFGWWSRVYDV